MEPPILIPGRNWQANSYVVDDMLVDAGISEDRIRPYLGRIRKIVITHGHFDHIAGIERIAEITGAEILVGTEETGFLSNPDLSLCRYFGKEQPNISGYGTLSDGDRIGSFTVVHTPGHTRGSICLFRGQDGVLVSGDTLFSERGVYGRCDLPTGSIGDMKLSLSRLSGLPIESVWCGHGLPLCANGSGLAAEACRNAEHGK